MNTSLGYSKRTLDNTKVLLSGGGDKLLSEFIGSISWDAESKELKYTPIGGNETSLVTLGSNALSSTAYLPLSGGTLSNSNFGAQLTIERSGSANMAAIRFKNSSGTLGYLATNTVDGAFVRYNAAASASYTILDSSNSSVSKSGSTLTVKINGTSKSLTNTWNAMTGATSSANGTVGYVNAVPPKDGYNTKFLRADGTWSIPAYPTKASWNYDDVYVKSVSISGNNLRINKNGSNTDLTIPYASSAGSVAWSNISSKPINFKAYSGSLASGGWKTLQGKDSSPSIAIAYNNGAASWNSGTYSATLVYGNGDTRGLLDCAYNTPIVTFGGCWYAGANDNNPAWYMKISGTSGTTYNLNSMPYAASAGNAATVTTITKAQVTGALGYTPPTTNSTYNFSGTTFRSGYSSGEQHDCNSAWENGHYYYTSNGPSGLGNSTSDGALYVQSYNSSWVGQIAQDYRNGRLFVRGKNNGTWQSWIRVAHYNEIPTNNNQLTNGAGYITSSGSCNYASSAGNADTLDGYHAASFSFGHINDWSFTTVHNSNYVTFDKQGASGAPNEHWFNGFVSTHANYLSSYIVNDHRTNDWYLGYSNNGSTPEWKKIIHSGNIGSQSVNYASSAGNADTVDSLHASNFGRIYNSGDIGNNSSVTVNDMAGSGGSNATFGMVYGATDNPTGTSSWVHVWSQQWSINVSSSWVSQIAIGAQARNGMWYRTTDSAGGIAGLAWKRVLDSSNYSGYALPLSGGTLSGNLTISHATNATMTAASTNPKITFSENGTLPVHLTYTDYDNYRYPAGLKVVGGTDASPAWFEAEGNMYAANFYTTSDRNKKQNISSFSEHIRKFQLKDTEKWHYGVIAQEVPEMFRDGEEGNMTVNYNSILSYYVGILENKVKELEEKIKILENNNLKQ